MHGLREGAVQMYRWMQGSVGRGRKGWIYGWMDGCMGSLDTQIPS